MADDILSVLDTAIQTFGGSNNNQPFALNRAGFRPKEIEAARGNPDVWDKMHREAEQRRNEGAAMPPIINKSGDVRKWEPIPGDCLAIQLPPMSQLRCS